MWEITKNGDNRYDGQFYYAVQSTKIFCRPSCKSKIPLRQHVSFFNSIEEAESNGYRPCKRCRPESTGHYDPGDEMVQSVKMILQSEYGDSNILKQLPPRVGMSRSHLYRLFKGRTGKTLNEYLDEVRIEMAKKLIKETTLNNTEIGYSIGFQSLSKFYATFRKYAGSSPKEFGKNP